jgi:UDP-N-acetylmuramate dehydrogenase
MNVDAVAASIGFVALERDVPASELTTWRVGGPIALVASIGTESELLRVSELLTPDVEILVIGRGSNLLVADTGFAGLGLRLVGSFERVVVEETSVLAGGAVPLPVLARRSAAAGRAGLEFYVGIPGTVGGAVAMNAGGHGCETAEVLIEAFTLALGTASIERRAVGSLCFSYRSSAIAPREVVVGARFAVCADDPGATGLRIDEIVRWRREHQPGGANAGSVFSNPPGDSAGRLIDACGLRGLRVGGASVSEKHANFIQTEAPATADDVRALMREIARRVADTTGVVLTPEVRMVGFEGPPTTDSGMRA